MCQVKKKSVITQIENVKSKLGTNPVDSDGNIMRCHGYNSAKLVLIEKLKKQISLCMLL